jgi:hypothetical protein
MAAQLKTKGKASNRNKKAQKAWQSTIRKSTKKTSQTDRPTTLKKTGKQYLSFPHTERRIFSGVFVSLNVLYQIRRCFIN